MCRVIDVGRTPDATPYIVMELLEGVDIGALIRKHPLPVPTAVDYVIQALIALAEAHPHGLVHRDLKPPNLFVVGGSGMVKVLDFGIAKAADELRLTQSGVWLGSPQYMSPEQMMTPRDVDARTDIWSIGVTLYHMIAGALPFPSAQLAELAVMITSHPPHPIDCEPDLRAAIWRCLEKDRTKRFPDVAALAQALVPFGGPNARAYAAQVRTATAPGPEPLAVTTHAPPGATLPSLAAAPAQAPTPTPWPRWLLPVVGGAVVTAGAIAGYLILREPKPGSPPTPQREVVADRPVGVPIDAMLADAAVASAPAPAQGIAAEDYERSLLEVEDRIQRFAHDPPTVQASLSIAVQMSCALRQVARAKRYLARITDKARRDDAIRACRELEIEL